MHTWEVPAWGPYRPMARELDDLLHAVAVLGPLLDTKLGWPALTGKQRKAAQSGAERLRRSAHRMLAQGPRLGLDGDVTYPRDRSEVVFWFMSALENLLVPDNDTGDFTRKLAQRTAVLIGVDDTDRLTIHQDIIDGYRIRSKVAHGAVIPTAQLHDLPARLYGYLREAIRALIILGPRFDLATDCDHALLSHSVRQHRITDPVNVVIDTLPEAHRSLRPCPRTVHRRA